uniref:Uncharacterized protein n=1 Tax=Arundo donax TaxID=35708 RepID=A0A0A9FTA3_ARUDO
MEDTEVIRVTPVSREQWVQASQH